MAYRAEGSSGSTAVIAKTARRAAEAFFEANPVRKKCRILQGTRSDDGFFTTEYSSESWPKFYKDVTLKTATALPDIED